MDKKMHTSSESLSKTANIEEKRLSDILHPRNSPAMAFQAYEMLGGEEDVEKSAEQSDREMQKSEFILGNLVNPNIKYPKLDTSILDKKINELSDMLYAVHSKCETNVFYTIWDTAKYRMEEMYLLKGYYNFINNYSDMSDADINLSVAEIQSQNEHIYGKPEQQTTDSIIGEIWSQIDSKNLVGKSIAIKRELEFGNTINVAGKEITVTALKRNHDSYRLPQIPEDVFKSLGEKLETDNEDIFCLVNDYWNEVVQMRSAEERVFTPSDMLELFKTVHKMRDPDNTSGISVVMDSEATGLSWDSSTMSIKIGGKRKSIDNTDTMIAKIMHEYVVHAGRCISGLQTDLPTLGTGLFSEHTDAWTDYLTFEEGLASICEAAVLKNNEIWKPLNIEKPLAIALAYEGKDFRQIYETLWRVRILMAVKDGVEPTDKQIALAQRNSYDSTLRVFRGTPTEMPRVDVDGNPRVLTLNKDLAYLKGRLIVADFLQDNIDNSKMLDLIFKAKFDPTDEYQMNLVADYVVMRKEKESWIKTDDNYNALTNK